MADAEACPRRQILDLGSRAVRPRSITGAIDEPAEHLLRPVAEIVLLSGRFVVLTVGLLGGTAVVSSCSRPHRVAGLAFVDVELPIPSWSVSNPWRPEVASTGCVHAAAMPVVDRLGLVGSHETRRRPRDG